MRAKATVDFSAFVTREPKDTMSVASRRNASRWGRRLASLVEGRGLSSLTVCGRCPRDARLISFTRVLVVGQRLFSVGLGGARFRAPLDLPVLLPRVKNGLPRGTRAALSE